MSLALQKWVLDHPWAVILISLAFILISSVGFKNFTQNGDPRQFFGDDNPGFQYFSEMEDKYAGNEVVTFIIHPKNDQVFTKETLMVIEELTEEAWLTPNSTRVDSITNFQHSKVDGDEMFVESLVENARDYDQERVDYVKKIAMNEPAIQNALISTKGHVAGVFIKIVMDDANVQSPAIAEYARDMRDRFRAKYPDIEFLLTGTVIFTVAATEAPKNDMKVSMPLGFGIVIALLLLVLRSINLTITILALVVASLASGIGLGIWSGIAFSPLVGAAPAMILTLAVANSVHLLVSYQQERRLGKNRYEGMIESLRINMQPIFLTSSTTAIGFLCLNFSESPPFHDMGNMVAIGVMAAYLLSITMLPALVMVTPDKEYGQVASSSLKFMTGFADFVIKRQRPLFWIMGVLVIACAWAVPQNQLRDVWNEYFDETFEVRRANDFMMKELTGMNALDFSFPANPELEQGVMDPLYQKKLDEFSKWARQHDHVVSVNTYSDVIKRLNRDMHQGDDEFYSVPDMRELISQYTLLFEMSLPMGLGIDNQMTMDKMNSKVTIVSTGLSTDQVVAFEEEAYQWIDQNFPEYMKARGTGMDLIFGSLAIRNVKSMLKGTVLALVLISVLLVIALRSFKYGLLSLLPNLLPCVMAFGIWGVFVGQVGMAVSIVASLTIGIVVDDTVHFLSKYVRAKRELGYSTADAVRYSFKTVGVALVLTSILLSANFGVMALSHFQPVANMGILTAVVIVMALVVDFLFFVPLLLLLDQHTDRLKKLNASLFNKTGA
ncbi:MAG TPA: MMPL family transporter [Pseudomonadales bacterium]